MYKHIFGPVPSRRLGVSLGVDAGPGFPPAEKIAAPLPQPG